MLIENGQICIYVADSSIISATVMTKDTRKGEVNDADLPWHIHLVLDVNAYSEQRVAYPLECKDEGMTLVRELEERVAASQDAGRIILSVTAQTT